jgi:hypothetical protein
MQSDRHEKLDGRNEGKHGARYGAHGDGVGITDSDTSPMRGRSTGIGKAALPRSHYARGYVLQPRRGRVKGLLPCCIGTEY